MVQLQLGTIQSPELIGLRDRFVDFNIVPAIEAQNPPETISELETLRLLTEVDHLARSLKDHGHVPEATRADVVTNLQTALAETSMPYAVTRTAHRVETVWDPEHQRARRTFAWLGRCAVGVAESGYDFHFSEAAKKRVDVEVAEAAHAQEKLRTGTVQFFLSPRMSGQDASVDTAKAEHLHDEDSIRASYLVTDSSGKETYRVMESLLVSDVPLDAWVAMLRDENNMFGQSIEVADEESALSVMKTFESLQLPAEMATEGPVTLVDAVVPYIENSGLALSVRLQLDKFRQDQDLYEKQAKLHATEWYDFELELAESLDHGVATPTVAQFISDMTPLWSDEIRGRIENHMREDGFVMTREIAALAEKAKRNIIATKAGVKAGNEKVIEQVDTKTVIAIQSSARTNPAGFMRGAVDSRELEKSIVKQEVKVGGGCAGGSCGLKGVDPTNAEDVAAAMKLGIKKSEMKDKMVSYEKGYCPDCKKTSKIYYNKDTADATCPCGSTKIGNRVSNVNKPKKPAAPKSSFALAA